MPPMPPMNPGNPGDRAIAVRTYAFAVSTEDGPKILAFRMSNILFGRLPDNHFALNHSSVSRRHARISVTQRGVLIEDMGSQNGTTVNGEEVNGATPIRPGDVLRIGHVPVFYFGYIQPDDPPTVEFVENGVQVTPSLPPL